MAQRRITSEVWAHFTQPASGLAVCKECKEKISMGSDAGKTKNTSNMWTHLKIHHSALYVEAENTCY